MNGWFDHPAFQGGIAPLLSALVVGFALRKSRFAWLAVIGAYLTTIVLIGDFAFVPLTAGRKVIVVGMLAALAGSALDLLGADHRWQAAALAVVVGAATLWVFQSVLGQRDGLAAAQLGGATALFAGSMVGALLRLKGDGIRCGAAGLGLGLAAGLAAVLSASIGYFLSGIAIAAASGALLLLQSAARKSIAAGYTGALTIGTLGAMIATATFLLAALPWYALPLMLLVPIATLLPGPHAAAPVLRAALACGYAILAALPPVVAAWYATRGS